MLFLFAFAFVQLAAGQQCQNCGLLAASDSDVKPLFNGTHLSQFVKVLTTVCVEDKDYYKLCDAEDDITTVKICVQNDEDIAFRIRLYLTFPFDFYTNDFEIASTNAGFSILGTPASIEMKSTILEIPAKSANIFFVTFKYIGGGVSGVSTPLTGTNPTSPFQIFCEVGATKKGPGQNFPTGRFIFDEFGLTMTRKKLVVGQGTPLPTLSSAVSAGFKGTQFEDLYVIGNFEVDQSYKFGNYNIYMSPDVEIKITNGAILTLKDTKVSTCDDAGDPWNRINVENGTIITNSTFGYNPLTNAIGETIIKNGQSLVEIQDRGFGSFTNTRFENFNNKAITVNNTGGIGFFYGNKLLSNQAGFAGVELNNTVVALNGGLITSGGSTTTIQLGHNRFEGTNFGIKSNNSQLRARYNDFIAMRSTGVHANSTEVKSISLVKNSFENCPTSMRGINSNLAFSQNTIHGSERGIYLSGQNTNVSITNNEDMQVNLAGILYDRLRTGTSNIFHNGIDANVRGIHSHLVLGASMTVDDNNITSGQEGTFVRDLASPLALWNVRKNTFQQGSKGIYFIAGGGNTVNENKMLGNAIGALVEGGNSYSLTENEMSTCANAMQISASNSPTVACNYSNFSSRGFNFNGNCSQVDFATNLMKGGVGLGVGVDGIINKLQPFKGNLWYNSSANNAAQSYQGFGFTVNESFNPRHMPTSRSPQPWFEEDSNGTGEDCATFMSEIPKKVGATWAVVNSTYSNPRRGEAGLWIAKAQAYQYLKEHPEDATDDLSQAFLAAEAQSSVGKLYEVKQAMNATRTTMLGHINTMDGVSQQISTKMDELEVIDNNLAENPSAVELRTQHIDKVLEIKAKEAIIAAKTAQLQEDWTANLEAALALNMAIVATEEYALNEKSVNKIWLNTIARDLTPSTDELDVLRNVANQCPYSGGEAVYVARGLYQSYVEDATFDDELLCAIDQGRVQKENVVSTVTLAVYPNPATDMLQVLTANNSENAIFEILNTLGQVLYQGASNTIDVSNFQVGLYVCNLLGKGKVVTSSKFAIQH